MNGVVGRTGRKAPAMPRINAIVPVVHNSQRTAGDACRRVDDGFSDGVPGDGVTGEGGLEHGPDLLPAGDAFRDPALELGHFRVVAVVGHQAVAEHIGKDEDAAGVRLVVGEPEGEE